MAYQLATSCSIQVVHCACVTGSLYSLDWTGLLDWTLTSLFFILMLSSVSGASSPEDDAEIPYPRKSVIHALVTKDALVHSSN